MIVKFDNEELFDLYKGDISGKQKYSHDIIKRFKDKVDIIYVAENINILAKIRGLNVEKYSGRWSVRINLQFRMEFDYIKPNTILILKISKHYE